MKIRRAYNRTEGLTLVETMVVMAIFVMIMILVTSFQSSVIDYNKYSNDVISSAQDARSILTTIVKQLRSAKPGNNGSYPIATAASSTIVFYSDIDADGLVEEVTYFLATTTLEEGVIKPTGLPLTYNPAQEKFTILAYNIKNGTSTDLFDYYDDTYNGTTSPLVQPVSVSAVRLVQVNLLIDADPSKSPAPRLYSSDATLRNLKDNL